MSRIYGSPLTNVALAVRDGHRAPKQLRDYVLFFPISIEQLRLCRTGKAQKLRAVVGELEVVYL